MVFRVLNYCVVNSLKGNIRSPFKHTRLLAKSLQSAVFSTQITFDNDRRPENKFRTANLNIRNEKEYLKLQNDPDKFGPQATTEDLDDDDLKEEDFLQNRPSVSRKLRTKQYADMIKEHLQYNRVKEAIDVLEVRMLKEDRVKPENYIFNLVIGGCARAGYSKKAFQLYNKMKQRGLKVTGGTYTSLFNACANAPWPQDGLNKANHLRQIMFEKAYEPNTSNYNAMIKAFGRCGDLQTAFLLADEMIEKKLEISVESYNFLLQACASDLEQGFRHALLVWHKMLRRGLKPDIYSFKNLLRCVRDCSMGTLEDVEEVIKEIAAASESTLKLYQSKEAVLINKESSQEVTSDVQLPAISVDETPNLLSKNPHLGSLMSINEVKTAEDRFLLIGGFSGFLEEMKKAAVTPGIEIFTQLLEVVPSTTAMEKLLISTIRRIGLKSDIDFFNILIKKRSMRFDYEGAKEVLSMIRTAKLHPDIVTYGVLALGCSTQEEARELLEKMHENDVRMNIQILGAMLRQGCVHKNFTYVHEIMKITTEENIRPNKEFLTHLDKFQKQCQKLIKYKHPDAKSKTFVYNFNAFNQKLNNWYERLGIKDLKLEDAIKKVTERSYQQFKEDNLQGYEEIKNEDLQRKQKKRKYIKRLKLDQLSDGPESSSNNILEQTRN